MFDMRKHQGVVDLAVRECWEFSRRTGREFGVLIGPEGGVVARAEGDRMSVNFDARDLLWNEGGVVVHSHPSGNSLSPQDLVMAAVNGVDIVAVGALDGSTYWTDIDVGSNLIYHNMEVAEKFHYFAEERLMPIAGDRARRVFGRLGGRHKSVVEIGSMHEAIWELTRVIKKVGVCDFRYQWKLAAQSVGAVCQWNELAGTDVPLSVRVVREVV